MLLKIMNMMTTGTSNLVTKAISGAKIIENENKRLDHDHDEYIPPQKFKLKARS